MRMWMINPKVMCRKHLLGEHVELHMFVGHLSNVKSVKGYLKNNLLEPRSIEWRHEQLVEEMLRRGYNHNSPLDLSDALVYYPLEVQDHKINIIASLKELLSRCEECKANIDVIFNNCSEHLFRAPDQGMNENCRAVRLIHNPSGVKFDSVNFQTVSENRWHVKLQAVQML